MGTIDDLKKEALNELKQETNEATETNEVKETLTGEVIAEIISFDNLQAKLKAKNTEALNLQIAELLKANNYQAIAEAIASQTNEALKLANNLPKFSLFQEGGVNYLVQLPKIEAKVKTTGTTGTKLNTYPAPFAIGDRIQLKDKEFTSQVYKVTQAGLVGERDNQVYRASIAVLRFEQTIGNKRAIDAQDKSIFAGTTYSKWNKVQ